LVVLCLDRVGYAERRGGDQHLRLLELDWPGACRNHCRVDWLVGASSDRQ
jgi:hypothetical protein